MAHVDIYLDWDGRCRRIGLMRRHPARNRETVTFEYDPEWIAAPDRFSIDPALPVGAGIFRPPHGREMFGTIGDSAPDTWGRTLMKRKERRAAEREGRDIRTLHEADYLLGVNDVSRMGALRFAWEGDDVFQAPKGMGIPRMVAMGDLVNASKRILAGEETDDDLQVIFAPGSSLGGARPKASILDQHDRLSIAKFPKQTDDYPVERWEAIALDMATAAGIKTPGYELAYHDGRPIMLSHRFDRDGDRRIPFISAMSLTEHQDGDRGSYLDIVDAITENGVQPKKDRAELFRRMVFTILISNTDDHLRNHGFLWSGQGGWYLSPAYDINPTPADIKPRILSTNIDFDDGTCSIDLARGVSDMFSLKQADADRIIRDTATICRDWHTFAARRGATESEIQRLSTAFMHEDLEVALTI